MPDTLSKKLERRRRLATELADPKTASITEAAIKAGYSKSTIPNITAHLRRDRASLEIFEANRQNAFKSARVNSVMAVSRLAHFAFASIDMFLDENGIIDLAKAQNSGANKFARSIDVVENRNGDIMRKIALFDPIQAVCRIAGYAGWKRSREIEHSENIEKLTAAFAWWLDDHPNASGDEKREVIDDFADAAGVPRVLLKEHIDPEDRLPAKESLCRYKERSYRRERFALEMANPENRSATEAARRAGYLKNSARHTGSRNLRDPDVAEAVDREKRRALEGSGVTHAQAVGRLTQIAFGSLDLFYGANGEVNWPAAIRSGALVLVRSLRELTLANGDVFRSVHLHDSARAAAELLDFDGGKYEADDEKTVEKVAIEFSDFLKQNPAIASSEAEKLKWVERFASSRNLSVAMLFDRL